MWTDLGGAGMGVQGAGPPCPTGDFFKSP